MRISIIFLSGVLCCVGVYGQTIDTSGNTTFCEGGSVSLMVSSGTGITGYQWLNGNTAIANEVSAHYNATSSGMYRVTLNRATGIDTTIGPIVVKVNPKPAVAVNSSSICLGESAILSASGANSFTWAPATGLSATTGSVVTANNPAATITYTVTGTNTNTGCSNVANATVTVNANPVADFTFTPANLCSSVPIAFTNISTGAASYSWNFGDPNSGNNNISNSSNPTHKFIGTSGNELQTFNVTLTVKSSAGCASTKVLSVTNKQSPDRTLGGTGRVPYNGEIYFRTCGVSNGNFTFTNQSSTVATNIGYQIVWGDGSPDYTSQTFSSVTHTYPVGPHPLLFIVSGNNGCTDTTKYFAFVGTNPAVGLENPGNTTICGGGSLTFPITGTASNAPGTLYTVTFNDGTAPITYVHPNVPSSVSHFFDEGSCGTASSDGTNIYQNSFSASILATNPCLSSAATVVPIHVSEKSIASFTIDPRDKICIATPVIFRNISLNNYVDNENCLTGNAVWSVSPAAGWSINSGSLGNDYGLADPSVWQNGSEILSLSFTTPGLYTIKIKTGSTEDCGTDDTTQIICITAPPAPAFTLSETAGCLPFTTQATNTTNTFNSCQNPTYSWTISSYTPSFCGTSSSWNFAPGSSDTSTNPSFIFNNAGTYTIEQSVNNACGTFKTSKIIKVKKPPAVSITLPPYSCGVVNITPVAVVASCTDSALTYAWAFEGGNPAVAFTADPGNITFTTAGPHVISLSVKNECGIVTATNTVNIDTVSTADSGPSQNICGTVATMSANVPVIGTGRWTRVSGSSNATITNPASPVTTITNLAPGNYTFRWAITNGNCTSASDVSITITPGATIANAGTDQNLCLTTSASLTGNTPVIGTGTWAQLSGPTIAAIATPASPSTSVSGLVPGVYTFSWTISFSNCSPSIDEIKITVYENPSASDAGADQTICSATTALAATNPAIGNGTWAQLANSPNTAAIANPTSASTALSGLIPGIYKFKWTVTNGPCTSTEDTVQINVTQVATSPNAGTDIRACAVSTINLAGNTALVGTGVWAQTSGPAGAVIKDAALANTTVTGLVPGTYVFSWTITNGNCPPGSDAVQVTIDENVTVAVAGPDQNKCGTSVDMAANVPNVGTGLWTTVSGPGGAFITSPSLPATTITALVPGTYIFRWTITNGSCSGSSDVTVKMFSGASPAIAGNDQNLCLATTANLQAILPVTGVGQWLQTSGPTAAIADASSNTTAVNGLVPGAYAFRWTVTYSNCEVNSDDINIIVYDNPSIAIAGTDQTICASTASLTANTPAIGTGAWSQLGNSPNIATIANPASASTALSGLIPGIYKFKWTITSGPCTPAQDTVEINVSAIATTPNAGPDAIYCALQSIVLSGNVPQTGTGLWSNVNGPNTPFITTAGNNATTVTGLLTGTYTFQWTITNGVCPPGTDQVNIIILDSLKNSISAAADTICAGQLINLTGALPSGGKGTYDYQWQQSTNGNTWADIAGETNQHFSGILNVTSWLRRKVTSLPCENFSNVILITVQPGISNNIISANDSICINTKAAIISGSVPEGGDGMYAYQWQKSINGGTSWDNIAGETGINYNPGILIESTQYRRLVNTSLCSGPQANISGVVIITINPDSRAEFTGSPAISCTPFLLNPVISVSAYPDRNLLYTWYADGIFFGSSTTGAFPGYSINEAGDTVTIKLVTSSQFGCKPDSAMQKFISVKTAVANFTKDTASGCGPLLVTFRNTSNLINNTIQFFWNFGNGITSALAQPGTINFTQSLLFTDTTYQITLKAYNGCDTTVWRDSVRIRSNPKARFGVDTTAGCSPFTVRITNNSLGTPNTYYWDFGNGHKDTTFVNGTLNYTYNIGNMVDTFPIRLIAVNECYRDTQVINVRIAPNAIKPQITIDASDLFGCTPHIVAFNNATIGATSFTWDYGDNTTPDTTNNGQSRVVHTFRKAGIFTISIRITNGCSDSTVYRQVTVFEKPKADFATNGVVYCLGDSIGIDNKSLNASNYTWFWGDGQSSSGFNPTHTYSAAGDYTIVLRAEKTNSTGIVCFDTLAKSITILVKPDVRVQSNITNINCAPFTLSATTPGIINETVSWYITDTTVSPSLIVKSGISTQYAFNKPGTFSIKMVAVNALGCKDSALQTFTVRGTPAAAFTPLNVSVCKIDTTVSYVNTTIFNDNGPINYRWFTDGAAQSINGNFTFRYVTAANTILPRIFTTQLIATNTVGCSDTATGILQMNPGAKAQFSISNPGACVPFMASLTNTSQYSTSYKWLLNGTLADTAANPNILVTQSSTPYTITLIADNIYGCKPDTFSVSFTSRVQPKAVFTVSDTLGCNGALNVITANQSSNANTYQWDWGDGSANSSFGSPTHLYNFTGQYKVTMIASDGVCKDTADKLITVATKPVVDFAADDTLTCDTARIKFTNLTNNADGYLWSFSDGTFSTATDPVKIFAPGSLHYTVKLAAFNNAGCSDSLLKTNLIFAIAPPAADFQINPSPVITVPDYTFTFNNLTLNSNTYTYQWSLGDGAFASTRDITHKYADTGNYQVRLIVLDNSTGCPDTTLKFARIEGLPGYLYVPNAFYPNSIRNEFKTFKPLGKGLADYHLQIFDSWGKLLFETRALDAAGSPVGGWDGTDKAKGMPMPQDAYAWRIVAYFKSGKKWDGMQYDSRSGKKQGNTFGTVTLFR